MKKLKISGLNFGKHFLLILHLVQEQQLGTID
jgi:hypothetical protein